MQFFALAIFLVFLVMIPSASAEEHNISITDDMKFDPEDLTINVGDTVNWTNNDGIEHTATSTDGPASFDSGNIAAGDSWSFTFTEAGTYNYKCDYHSSMNASITVVESDDEDDSEEDSEAEEAPDGDNDGISDEDDSCPEEDASGHDADADGCIDDSDNDGVKNDVDVCPFDATDACIESLENNNTFAEGCTDTKAKNYDAAATDDDGSCQYEVEDSSSVGIVMAVFSCLIISLRKRN